MFEHWGNVIVTKLNCEKICNNLCFAMSFISGQMKLILARLSVIEQCQRHPTEVSQQILNVLQHRELIDNLPDCIKDKIPLQTLSDVQYVEEKLGKRDSFRKLVRKLILILDLNEVIRVPMLIYNPQTFHFFYFEELTTFFQVFY